MGYQLTPLGVATPVNEFPRFVTGLAEIHNLDRETAVLAVRTRVAALEADLAEMESARDGSKAPAMYLTALDYLLATTRSKLDWLRGFAESVESGRLDWHRPSGVAV